MSAREVPGTPSFFICLNKALQFFDARRREWKCLASGSGVFNVVAETPVL
jgi:hypothetical protein